VQITVIMSSVSSGGDKDIVNITPQIKPVDLLVDFSHCSNIHRIWRLFLSPRTCSVHKYCVAELLH